jgi:hypothetical protein
MSIVNTSTVERRVRTIDRRRKNTSPAYPFRDSNGIKVTVDRRTLPDRRIGNIQVEWGEEIELATRLK